MSFLSLIKKLNILFIIIIFSSLLVSLSPFSVNSANISLDNEEETLLNLINEYRQSNGLSPLILSSELTIAAKMHSQDMANNNYFSHYSLDGRSPYERAKDAGYFYLPIGENIAAGYTNAIDVFNAWKGSIEHNKNMLNKDFKAMGIGRAYNSSSFYKWYWTVVFGGDTPIKESLTSTTIVTRTYTFIIYMISYITNYTTTKEITNTITITTTETLTSYILLNLTLSTITTRTINQTNIFSSTIFTTSIIPKTIIVNSTRLESLTTTISKTYTTSYTLIITKIEKLIEMPIIQISIISILILMFILILFF